MWQRLGPRSPFYAWSDVAVKFCRGLKWFVKMAVEESRHAAKNTAEEHFCYFECCGGKLLRRPQMDGKMVVE